MNKLEEIVIMLILKGWTGVKYFHDNIEFRIEDKIINSRGDIILYRSFETGNIFDVKYKLDVTTYKGAVRFERCSFDHIENLTLYKFHKYILENNLDNG